MRARRIVKKLLHSYCPGLSGWFKYFGTRVYFPNRAWIFDLACQQGIYEADLLKLLMGLVTPGSWYFDVGANIGLMSVPILKTVQDCHVLSLEPSSNSSPFLERTWQESPWKQRWVVKRKAVGAQCAQVEFYVGPRRFGGFDGLRHTGRAPCVAKELVPVTTLDREWITLGRPTVSCVKLDIEGAELEALDGGRELLTTRRPYVILEWYPENFRVFGHVAEDLLKLSDEIAYDLVALPSLNVVGTATLMAAHIQMTASYMLVPR